MEWRKLFADDDASVARSSTKMLRMPEAADVTSGDSGWRAQAEVA